jgi:hypothetical protein
MVREEGEMEELLLDIVIYGSIIGAFILVLTDPD